MDEKHDEDHLRLVRLAKIIAGIIERVDREGEKSENEGGNNGSVEVSIKRLPQKANSRNISLHWSEVLH